MHIRGELEAAPRHLAMKVEPSMVSAVLLESPAVGIEIDCMLPRSGSCRTRPVICFLHTACCIAIYRWLGMSPLNWNRETGGSWSQLKSPK